MKTTFLQLFLFLILISCKNDTSKIVIDEDFCREQLEISIDENKYIIDYEGNYLEVVTESIINYKSKFERKSFELTPAEKKKLFSNAYQLITLKEYTIYTKTCFAGQNFTLRLVCDNKALEFHHSSVANWSKISKETKAIFSILNSKVKVKK